MQTLIAVTARPQGYNNDFSPEIYEHWWLTPLSLNQALHYAKRLVEERYRSDDDRRARVLARLQRAAEHTATRRLMQSPLQITILAALVDQIGQAPRDRWRLFHEYYGVIFRREIEKPIAAASILRDYRTDVDVIHRSVGLLLQASSEERGGTNAYLSIDQLSRIVRDRLSDRGHEGQDLARISHSG